MERSRFKLHALSVGIISALSMNAFAEEQIAEVDDEIEQIVVTATKRNAAVQDVSVAVTALDAEAIKRAGIEDITRLEHVVPGMKFGQSGNEVRLALRGTRTNNVGTEAEQVVGIFEDGVYVATTTQALGAYVDVDRIEVLRGPQGTLYGRNTFGGTINIHTRKPNFDEVEGYLNAVVGSYDRLRYEGAINIPIGDTFAARFAVMGDSHDGYIENTYVDGTSDDLSDKDIDYFRGAFRWSPVEELDVTLRLGTSTSKGNGNAIWGYQQIGGYIDGMYSPGHLYSDAYEGASEPSVFDQGPWKVARNMQSGVDIQTDFYTLNVEYDFDFATLQYTANLTEFDGAQWYDPDYTDGADPVNSGFVGWTSTQDTTSHELQLISNTDNALEWLLGLYYFEQTANWNWLQLNNDELEVPHWDRDGDYISDSFGAFAHVTYDLDEDNRVVGGLRYAEDSKQQRDPLDWDNADWSVWPPVIPVLYGQGEKSTWDKVLWKLGYEHDLNDDVMAYAQVSTGYRAGGINGAGGNGVPASYDPETVTAWELGYKSTWLDNSLTFNASAYYNQYEDMQAQSFVLINGNASEYTENGGELDAMGLELELAYQPGNGLNVSAQLALMDAEFGDYKVSKVTGLGDINDRQSEPSDSPLINLSGWRPALASDLTLGFQASYDFDLADFGVIRPYFQTSYVSDYYASDFNLDGVKQDGYTKSDFRVIWQSASGTLEAQAFVLNIEDEAVLNRVAVFNPGAAPNVASLQANWGNPRTWGVSVTYNF
ncbi:TonB-dependent receptor [Thalassotalea litorea]|uniref:TonB-dependent receptor n=1 Tax=Thalassotalea litorea TaxID=2020715 RepID=UPI003735E8B2